MYPEVAVASLSDHIKDQSVVAEPMPAHIQPMLATLSELPGEHRPYAYEYKWDGIRALYFLEAGQWRVETRNLNDVTVAYPELADLAAGLEHSSAILDGEIVAMNEHGHPSFGRLSHRLGLTEAHAAARAVDTPVTYMIFDVLYLDGYSLMPLEYRERRGILEELGLSGESWKTPPSFTGDGGPVLDAARENHLEGVVAKKLDSPYRQGLRTKEWLKIKIVRRQEFVIGGWTPLRTGAPVVGALLIGYYEPGKGRDGRRLIYAGSVGTGFSEHDRETLARLLESRQRDTNPFAERVPKASVMFAEPELVGEVEYRGWTGQGHLRQPSFKGLRDDKEPTDVVREDIVKK